MISCALIGFGYWGPNIARILTGMKNANLTAICDVDPKKIAAASSIYPNVQTYRNLDTLLAQKNIDAIIIASPAITHFEIARDAIRAGYHVLIEKPMTSKTEQANRLKKLAHDSKTTVMVGHTFEFNPAILKIKDLLESGQLGRLYYIYCTRVNLGQIRDDVNSLWNLAPHDISILNFLLDSLPLKVAATGVAFIQNAIEDVVFVQAIYPKNVLAQIHVSWLDPVKIRNLTLVASKKMVVFDDLDNEMPLKIYDKNVKMSEIAKGQSFEYKIRLHSGDIYAPQVVGPEPLVAELKHFFDCITKNQKPTTDVENGARVVRVLAACQKSLKNGGKWITV